MASALPDPPTDWLRAHGVERGWWQLGSGQREELRERYAYEQAVGRPPANHADGSVAAQQFEYRGRGGASELAG